MSRVENMSRLERIDGLINQNLLQDLKKTITVITLDLYEEGFEADEIAEYLNIIGRGKVLTTIVYKDNK